MWPTGDPREGTPNLFLAPSVHTGFTESTPIFRRKIRQRPATPFSAPHPDISFASSSCTFDLHEHLASAGNRGELGSRLIDVSLSQDHHDERLLSYEDEREGSDNHSDEVRQNLPVDHNLSSNSHPARRSVEALPEMISSPSCTDDEQPFDANAEVVRLKSGVEEYRQILTASSVENAALQVRSATSQFLVAVSLF